MDDETEDIVRSKTSKTSQGNVLMIPARVAIETTAKFLCDLLPNCGRRITHLSGSPQEKVSLRSRIPFERHGGALEG